MSTGTFAEQLKSFLPSWSAVFQDRLVECLLVITVLVLIRLVAKIALRRQVHNLKTRYTWQKFIEYCLIFIGLILLWRIWFRGTSTLATFLGLISVGVVISLRDLVANFAGWIFILSRTPFQMGDRVEIASHKGDVLDIRMFQFTLMEVGNWVDADQSTGRIIHVPNAKVLTDPLANYTKGFHYIWNEIPILLTFDSNWKKAKKILQDTMQRQAEQLGNKAERALKEASRRWLLIYSNLTPAVYVKAKDDGILLTMRYLCKPRERRNTEEAIWENILEIFARHRDIAFAHTPKAASFVQEHSST